MKKRPMFVGPIGCGKTSIIQRLTDQDFKYNKTQSVEFVQDYIDTPGEYIEHRRMYTHIATTAMDASVVVMIQSAADKRLIFPQGFALMFSAPVIAVVNKIDLLNEDQDPLESYAAGQLKNTGANEIMSVSALTGENIPELLERIRELNASKLGEPAKIE